MNNLLRLFAAISVASVIIPAFLSNSNGPGTDATGSPVSSYGIQGCRGCHSSGGSFNPLTGITVTGLPTSYYPGNTYTLTLNITNPTAKNGFQLAALNSSNGQAGSWTTGTGTKTITQGGRSYIEHNAGSSSGSWTFNWTAPATNSGAVNFYASANASNNNGGTSGDAIYTYTSSVSGINSIAASETISNASCATATDGSIQINLTGGVPGYTSAWSNGSNFTSSSYTLSGLSAGAYSVTITDAAGNSETEDYTVGADIPFAINGTSTGALCVLNNGTISTNVTGASFPLSFAWSTGAATSSISQLAAGIYGLTVTDGTGCSVDTTIVVPDLGSGMVANWQSTDASCGNADGALSFVSSNAQSPVTALWSTGDTSLSLTGLQSGVYTVTLTDVNGCTESFSDTVANQDAPTVTIVDLLNVDCFGEATGEISLATSGGTGSKTVSWLGPNGFSSGDSVLTGLKAGIYTYSVTDANQCEVEDSVEVSQPDSALEIVIDSLLFPTGSCNGYIAVSVVGGNAANGYQLNWIGPTPSATEIVLNACSGTYLATAIDDVGCLDTLEIELSENTGLWSLSATNLRVYPNPATEKLTIAVEGNPLNAIVSILDHSGRVVLNATQSQPMQVLDISELNPGNYLLRVETSAGRVMQTVIGKL